jgi:cytoskeleton protein RodZ
MIEPQEPGPQAGDESASAGKLLRQLREAAGVHIAAMAVSLKVPVKKLEALEADRHEAFADAVFERALASSVCRALKTDPAPVLALLPQSAPTPLKVDEGLNAAFKSGGGQRERWYKSWPAGVAALLLAAVVIIALWPRGVKPPSAQSPAARQAAPAGQPRGEPPANETPLAPAPAPPATAPAVASSSPAPVSAPVPAPAPDGALVIRAHGQSWVQVRDAAGAVLLDKTLEAGESVSAPGAAPWSGTVGRVDAVDVTVRGKPMDLSAIARQNVAHFEVK